MINLLLLSLFSFTDMDVFEGKPIYKNPLAYIRSPDTGVSLKSSKWRGADLQYLDAVIGRTIPVLHLHEKYPDIQFGLEASTWAVLGYYEGRFPLITQDFLIAAPLMFRAGSWSGALKFNHLSSHRSDGFDLLWDKTLSPEEKQKIETVEHQQNISISPPIKNYSRDFWSLDIAKEMNVGKWNIKYSTQLAYIHKIIPHGLGRWFGGSNVELRYFGFYIAQNFMYYGDVNNFDISGQIGMIDESHSHEPRICVSVYRGSDRRGQFLGRKIPLEVGLGIFIR